MPTSLIMDLSIEKSDGVSRRNTQRGVIGVPCDNTAPVNHTRIELVPATPFVISNIKTFFALATTRPLTVTIVRTINAVDQTIELQISKVLVLSSPVNSITLLNEDNGDLNAIVDYTAN